MLRVLSFVACFGLFSVAVTAAPVYLDCDISTKEDKLKFSVKLDEATGKVTHTWSKGGAFNSEAFFAPNTVSYQDVVIAEDIKISMQYEINRKTLLVQRQSNIEALNADYAHLIPSTVEKLAGSCLLVEVAGKKF